MITNTLSPSRQPMPLANAAQQSANSIESAADTALGSVAGAVQDLREQAVPLLTRATEQAAALAQRGVDSVRDTSLRLRDKAQHAGDTTLAYIRAEPVKATLIAAATGAALMALLALLSRSRERA